MGAIMNFVRGWARVELSCRYPERAVNICAGNHVEFWDLVRTEDGAAQMSVSIPGYMKLRRVAEETGAFSVRIVKRSGVPFFLWRIRKRYALLLGLVVCLTLTGLSSVFVWQIDVVGNETVPTSEILAALKNEGVDIGVCVLDITEERVANRMLLRVPELSFITLNNHGSRIEVICREKVAKPELYDRDEPTGVFARKAGIISEITALDGWTKVKAGDAVVAGDELISAYVPIGAGFTTHASGRVLARTWYEMSLKMPLETEKKEYTGEKRTRTALILGGKRINLYFLGGNPYTSCDKITSYKTLTLPGGAVLPVTVVRETYEEYRRTPAKLTEKEAEQILSVKLLDLLEDEIGDGWIVSDELETASAGGVVTVTLKAECVEEIGEERKLTEEEVSALKAAP